MLRTPLAMLTALTVCSLSISWMLAADQTPTDASAAKSKAKHASSCLRAPMNLAGRNLINVLSPERDYLPYWQMVVDADATAHLWFRPSCNAHNIGRWWDAMLQLEDATGFAIPMAVEAGMLRNMWRYTDNPWGILLDITDDPKDAGKWYIHSFIP